MDNNRSRPFGNYDFISARVLEATFGNPLTIHLNRQENLQYAVNMLKYAKGYRLDSNLYREAYCFGCEDKRVQRLKVKQTGNNIRGEGKCRICGLGVSTILTVMGKKDEVKILEK